MKTPAWLLALILAAVWPGRAQAGYKDDIGLTALQLELGGAMPTGAGISLRQVEARDGGNYAPDAAHPELAGKTITLKSGASDVSGHATGVARSVYGTTNGTAPGITVIDVYEAANYLGAGFLQTGNPAAAPVVETRRIQNNSWIGSAGNAIEATRRLDFAIKRDGFVAVVGLNNSSATVVPDLLAHSYNAICVGQSSGDHSRGGTRFDTAGRSKPDLVTPSPFSGVSYSVGVVSGAAALLLQKADSAGGLANARNNSEVIKAVLMAGATKQEFPTWNRTATQPLDPVYGAGELNVHNSYHILAAGEQAASNGATVGIRGWDLAATGGNGWYFFDVPAGYLLTNMSAALVWNRDVYDANSGAAFDPQVRAADLDLRLYTATNFTLLTLVDSSVGTNDNVEHIFAGQLAAGRYALTISWSVSGQDYALAWQGTPIALPAPGWLEVSPAGNLNSSGTVGGPFDPPSATYTLTNAGGSTLQWTATNAQAWLSLSAAGGSLAAGVSTNVTVFLNTGVANSLPPGSYSDSVHFANATTGAGDTSRAVNLTVNSAGWLAVSPEGGFQSSGYVGGPFTPAEQVYVLSNAGGSSLQWTITTNGCSWLALSARAGALGPGASTNIMVALAQAGALPAGGYSGTVGFTNLTTGSGNTIRAAMLTVQPVFLSVRLSNASVTVAWPSDATGFRLQTATNSGGAGVWSDVPLPYQTNDMECFVTDASAGRDSRFYRLCKP